MKNLLPLIILMIMGLMLMVSWSNISDTKTEVSEKYKTLMQEAERYESKKIYVDALKQYDAALKLKPEYDLALRVAGLYQQMGDDKGYMDTLETAIKCDPTNPEPYFKLIKVYQESGEADKLYKELVRAKNALSGSDRFTDDQQKEIQDLLKVLLGKISVYPFAFDECSGFHRYEGKGTSYARVRSGDQYGLIGATMSTVVTCSVDDINYMNGGLIPIRKNGEYYWIDNGGNRKIVPDSAATEIGGFGGGIAPLMTMSLPAALRTVLRRSSRTANGLSSTDSLKQSVRILMRSSWMHTASVLLMVFTSERAAAAGACTTPREKRSRTVLRKSSNSLLRSLRL